MFRYQLFFPSQLALSSSNDATSAALDLKQLEWEVQDAILYKIQDEIYLKDQQSVQFMPFETILLEEGHFQGQFNF